jgi:sugar phosphate isomerase/epimerase
MYKQKIGISIENRSDLSVSETLQTIKNVGFDAISPGWQSYSELLEIVKISGALGLEIQSLHAPFGKIANMWSRNENISSPVKKELFEVIDACAEFHIPIAVMHVWIGFDYQFDETDLYYNNFDELVRYAEARHVKIAFENTEGIEYLFALMAHFQDNDTVGFCWDSGHQMCYNDSEDLLFQLGDRLMMTHLNDNLGVSRFDGKIYWTDDLHLLPFDGIADWDDNVRRLIKARYLPILNFELSTHSKPNRHENDVYAQMIPVQYFTEAYKRACRIASRYSRGL